MNKPFHFVQYHNAVPIALGIVVLGAGGVFAATNPEAIYSVEQTVLSVDNTYIAEKDLTDWSPTVHITGVTEDSDNYYVTYDFSTIALEDYVWKDLVKNGVMIVSKADLGEYRDLGLYVMAQLKQVVDREIAFLKEVQEIEKRSVSQKMVATAYGGLVGALLDDKTEVIPGYEPVVEPPKPPEPPPPPAGIVAGISAENPPSSTSNGIGPGIVLSGDPSDTEAPYIQILGSNPVILQEGDYYLDLGAVAADNGVQENVVINVYLNGEKKERIYFAQAPAGEWLVTYEAIDKAGNIARTTRVIKVAPKQAPPPAPEPAPPPEPAPSPEPVSTSSPQATPAPEAEPTQTPAPEPTPTPEPSSTSTPAE